jgi:hypothetical protein
VGWAASAAIADTSAAMAHADRTQTFFGTII